MRIPHNGGYIVVASYGGAPTNPAWYHNLRANPVVDVQDGAVITTMRATDVAAEETDRLWPVCEAIWPDFPEYRARTTRDIPMFVLTPEPVEPTGAPADPTCSAHSRGSFRRPRRVAVHTAVPARHARAADALHR